MPIVASLSGIGTFKASEFSELDGAKVSISGVGTVTSYEFDENTSSQLTGFTRMRYVSAVGIGTTVVVFDSIDEVTENIVSSGLQVNFDAGNPISYPGTGSIWYDISGNNYTATLSSSSYTTDGGGGIYFASSSSSASYTAALNFSGGFTLETWIKHTGTVSNVRVQRYMTLGSSPLEGPVLRHNSSTNDSLHGYLFDSGSTFRSIDESGQIFTDNYYHLVYTYDGTTFRLYNNNIQVGQLVATVTLPTLSTSHQLPSGGGEYFEGNMYVARYYNRGLTAQEVNQNFNALRSRFAI